MLIMRPKKVILGLFPILEWWKTYTLESAIGDVIAGVTIALTLIPQSMAYAALAGLAPQYGLYASFMAPFVYALMGTCPQINMGPSALLSLLTYTYTHGTNADFGIFLGFLAGITHLIAGVSGIGSLVEYISVPVVSGFTSAAALTIASSQVKGLLGLSYVAGTFVKSWRNFFGVVHKTRLMDSVLSIGCCTTLLTLKTIKEHIKVNTEGLNERQHRRAVIINRFLWFVGVSRNATVVTVATVTAFCVYKDIKTPFLLTGVITPGLPAVRPPPFQTSIGNTTYSAIDMMKHLGSGLIVVPAIGILANVAIVKAFAKGKKVNAKQEILALGVCNVISSFFQSMLVNGSFSRSAVSNASGVRTPGSGIYTGILVVFTLLFLTPYFYFIPRAALASVIVCAVLQMVDYEILRTLWKISRPDMITLLGTFFSCLVMGVEVGLICGVCIDAILLLYYNSRPYLDIKYNDTGSLPAHYSIHPIGGLHFAGAEYMRSKLTALLHPKVDDSPSHRDQEAASTANIPAPTPKSTKFLVVHCDELYRMDYTFLQDIQMLVIDWSRTGRVIWCNAKDSIKNQLKGVLTNPVFCTTKDLGSNMIVTTESQGSSEAEV
ncbi:unnamed protein product [Chrysodeixis includens]|uniref:SLC26A/SulP transporter domain-containing protein n=1 Tax=Chrysodeixis includens TaxID=689277 RepID=A0A9P0BLT5_CHRIL|nr:unnamed protein product [Chrysodeixis includens]